MERHLFKLTAPFAMLLAIAFVVPQRALADDDDPPSRVARLSYTHGPVSFQPAGTDDWVGAIVNRPITTGDRLWTDDGSRAELHIGSASIRMAGHTGFSFLNLSDNMTQVRLSAGTLRVRVKRLDQNEAFEIDTPNLAFSLLRPGVYRVEVNEAGDTTVVRVQGGEGEVTGGGSAFTVHAQEAATFNGTDSLTADFNTPWDRGNDFDEWCAERDRHEDVSASRRYVSPDVIGYEDLDDYGGWRPVPQYGYVWFPHTTVVGWAPYHYGHWAYVYPWGYTWIDDAPWGFAPFHYGRWVNYGGVWGWVPAPPPAPGVVYVRPVYAPALVAWVGGPHFAVGIGVGGGFAAGVNVGWFPLGPREVYVPSYPVSRTYINNVNVSNTTVNTTVINNYYNTTVVNRNTTVVNNNNVNVTQIHQTYVNQGVPGAVTATTPQAFTSAQSISRNAVQVNQREVAGAPVNSFTPSVAPSRQAVLGAGAAASIKPPAAVQTRDVVAKVTPPPPPVPFAKQQQAIQANGGRPLAISQTRQIQTDTAAPHLVRVAPPVSAPNAPANKTGQGQNQGQNTGGFKPFTPNGGSGQQQAGGGNKPGATTNAGQPAVGNQTGPQKSLNDRPPSARPGGATNTAVGADPALEQKHQQQFDQLRVKQDQERQKVEQHQQQERVKLAQTNASDSQQQQQLNQKHQQQLENLEKKHDQQKEKLHQKQQDDKKKKPSGKQKINNS